MPNKQTITVNNVEYPSIQSAAKHFGVKTQIARQRLAEGKTPEQAFNVPLNLSPSSKKKVEDSVDESIRGPIHAVQIEIGGNVFPSIASFARHYNLNARKVGAQLRNGATPESLIPTEKPVVAKKETPKFRIDGKSYHSISELAEAYHANVNLVTQRLQANWSVAQAVGLVAPPQLANKALQNETIQLVVDGQSFANLTQVAEAHGLKKEDLAKKLANGDSCEDAVHALKKVATPEAAPRKKSMKKKTQAKRSASSQIVVNGKSYRSERAVAKAHDVPLSTFFSRRERGMSIEAAIGLEKQPENKRSHAVTCQGKQYSSMRELARAYNVSPHQLRHKIRRKGMSPEEALGLKKKSENTATTKKTVSSTHRGNSINFRGTLYPSVKAFAAAYGQNVNTVSYRLKQGWTKAQAVGVAQRPSKAKSSSKEAVTPVKNTTKKTSTKQKNTPVQNAETVKTRGNSKAITYQGKTYPSARAFARAINMSPHRVRYRMDQGWTLGQIAGDEKAPSSPPKSTRDTHNLIDISSIMPVTVEGKTFNTAADLARHYNMDVPKVTGRLRNRWTPEESVGLADHKKDNYTFEGKTFETLKEVAKHYKTSYRKLQYRMGQGATLEQALGLEEWAGQVHQGKAITFNGHDYVSYRALAEDQKVSYGKMMGRLHRGWSIEEAVSGKRNSAASSAATEHVEPEKQKPVTASKKQPRNRRQAKSVATGKKRTQNKGSTLSKLQPKMQDKVKCGAFTFDSVEDFAKHLNMDPVIVLNRMGGGWKPSQIAGLETPPNL